MLGPVGTGEIWAAVSGNDTSPRSADPAGRPELADVGRLARRLTRRAVVAARSQDAPVQRLLQAHLGPQADSLPMVSGSWPPYEHVNVQVGLDAWLEAPGRRHKQAGLTGFRHMHFGLADLMQGGRHAPGVGLGSVATDALPTGPGGATRACARCCLYLVHDGGARFALLLRGPDSRGAQEEVTLEVAGTDTDRAQRALEEVRRLAIERSVYRGQVISFGAEVLGPGRGTLLSFAERPQVDRADVILPPDLLDGIEQQVLGVARHAAALLASGQHLKRGVLLHGPPGTGKTHTIRYLIGRLPGVTVIVLSGGALHMIQEACSLARALQPSAVVVEDVDLIAEQRGPRMGQHPLLFQLLNEMDGLGEDVDVTFLLTTNRADMLEEALAARPGRVDHAAHLPVPDADARARLLRLYQGSLVLDLADPAEVIARTEGVTASFIKELLRKAALCAADEAAEGQQAASSAKPLRVTDAHLNAALDQLLATRNQLTRVLLGGRGGLGADAVIRESMTLPRRTAR
jgi:hypothetical protein